MSRPQPAPAILASARSAAMLPLVALISLAVGFAGNPAGLVIHLFTATLILAVLVAFLGGTDAPCRGRLLMPAVNGFCTLVILQSALPVILREPSIPPLLTTNEAIPPLWRATFSKDDQAIAKYLALPPAWRSQPVYLRIDLGARYDGTAGFHVTVNEEPIGQVANEAPGPWFVGTFGYRWAIRVPTAVLERAPAAHVTIRPSALDPRLSIAGHPDARVDPFVPGNSRFLGGNVWRSDRLAGPDHSPVSGTYRIWLLSHPGDEG